MRSSTLFFLLAAFLIALSFSVANAGEEKEAKGKEEEKGEGKGEGSEEGGEGGEGEKSKGEEKSGALSVFNSNGLLKAASLAIACLLISIH